MAIHNFVLIEMAGKVSVTLRHYLSPFIPKVKAV